MQMLTDNPVTFVPGHPRQDYLGNGLPFDLIVLLRHPNLVNRAVEGRVPLHSKERLGAFEGYSRIWSDLS